MAYRADDGKRSNWDGNSAYGTALSEDRIQWDRLQKERIISENDSSNWATLWVSAFVFDDGVYYLYLEVDGPPVFSGARVNIVFYEGNLKVGN